MFRTIQSCILSLQPPGDTSPSISVSSLRVTAGVSRFKTGIYFSHHAHISACEVTTEHYSSAYHVQVNVILREVGTQAEESLGSAASTSLLPFSLTDIHEGVHCAAKVCYTVPNQHAWVTMNAFIVRLGATLCTHHFHPHPTMNSHFQPGRITLQGNIARVSRWMRVVWGVQEKSNATMRFTLQPFGYYQYHHYRSQYGRVGVAGPIKPNNML